MIGQRQAVGQTIAAAAETLAAAGVATARVDAEQLAAHAAGVERGRLMMIEPDPAFLDRYRALVAARAERVPLQHLTATAAFGPVTLEVGPGVFIPRPETEAMLEWALRRPLPDSAVVVDLCTGSGALAAAIAHARPRARVLAVDDSPDALRYARRNAATVDVLDADVTAPGVLAELDGRVDLVVCNPPYIPDGAELEPEVAEHDPAHALFGGPDGMAVIGPVVKLGARLLKPGGHLAIEHDDSTALQTVAVFQAAAAFADVTSHVDLTGRQRFVTGRRTEDARDG